jgi:hypothetical protein
MGTISGPISGHLLRATGHPTGHPTGGGGMYTPCMAHQGYPWGNTTLVDRCLHMCRYLSRGCQHGVVLCAVSDKKCVCLVHTFLLLTVRVQHRCGHHIWRVQHMWGHMWAWVCIPLDGPYKGYTCTCTPVGSPRVSGHLQIPVQIVCVTVCTSRL